MGTWKNLYIGDDFIPYYSSRVTTRFGICKICSYLGIKNEIHVEYFFEFLPEDLLKKLAQYFKDKKIEYEIEEVEKEEITRIRKIREKKKLCK